MGNLKLKGKDLRRIKYSNNKAIGLAIAIVNKHCKHSTYEEAMSKLIDVKENFENYINDEIWKILAKEFAPTVETTKGIAHKLYDDPKPYKIYGKQGISVNAIKQMDVAMSLPIVEKGALMPDAHAGYGLPIGGVVATKNAVIPYGVGVDIGCRMSLSIYDIDVKYIDRYEYQIKQALKSETNFGTGGELGKAQEHSILERDVFKLTPLLKQLHSKAVKQLGTSGSGNHFVEFGEVILGKDSFGLSAGKYLGLLSHSGSRGFGAAIANFYTKLAKERCLLPREAQHLAWLDLATDEGKEYWLSMNLAGDYAKACHDQIHYHLSKYLGIKHVARVENHHNFAWKQLVDGEEMIVHRKGATPAAKGELGIIPGTMTSAGYIVEGTGDPYSIGSASHGAGRAMSRKAAKESFTNSGIKKELNNHRVSLIGGGVDEAPKAYKDIEAVMFAQRDLVNVLGKFTPRIVRMDRD